MEGAAHQIRFTINQEIPAIVQVYITSLLQDIAAQLEALPMELQEIHPQLQCAAH